MNTWQEWNDASDEQRRVQYFKVLNILESCRQAMQISIATIYPTDWSQMLKAVESVLDGPTVAVSASDSEVTK